VAGTKNLMLRIIARSRWTIEATQRVRHAPEHANFVERPWW
jgi:hypothetical protein